MYPRISHTDGRRAALAHLGLEKTGANRVTREFLSRARQAGFTVPRRVQPGETYFGSVLKQDPFIPFEGRSAAGTALDGFLTKAMGYAPESPRQLFGLRRKNIGLQDIRQNLRPGKLNQLYNKLDRMRQQATGRHAPKPAETFVPALDWGEVPANQATHPTHVFRGNAPDLSTGVSTRVANPQGDRGVLTTGHPDVAAAYAIGNTGVQYTQPTQTVYAFPRSAAANGLGDGPADQYVATTGAEALAMRRARRDQLEQPYKTKRYRSIPAVRDYLNRAESRNYENYVPAKDLDFKNPAGEYTVRRSRNPATGEPGYAFADVRGTPAAELLTPKR